MRKGNPSWRFRPKISANKDSELLACDVECASPASTVSIWDDIRPGSVNPTLGRCVGPFLRVRVVAATPQIETVDAGEGGISTSQANSSESLLLKSSGEPPRRVALSHRQ